MKSTFVKLTAVANAPGRFLMQKVEVENGVSTTEFKIFYSCAEALAWAGKLFSGPTCHANVEGRLGEGGP